MQSNKLIGLGIGTGLLAGLASGVTMHLIGYESLAVGVGILTTCIVAFAVGYLGSLRRR